MQQNKSNLEEIKYAKYVSLTHTHTAGFVYTNMTMISRTTRSGAVELTFICPGATPHPKTGSLEVVVTDDEAAASGQRGHGIRSQILHRKIRRTHWRRAQPQHQGPWFYTYRVCAARHRRLRPGGALVFFWKAGQGVTSPLVTVTDMK